jgi:hypothetical protein
MNAITITHAITTIILFDSFSSGLIQMANYMGNVLLPIGSALVFGLGIYAYSTSRDGQRYFIAGMACLLVSGIARQAESFVGSSTNSAMFTNGILGLVNWCCNVMLPLYAVLCFARGALAAGGFMERFNIGDDWARYFISGFACLGCSGIVRTAEYFIVNSQGGLH